MFCQTPSAQSLTPFIGFQIEWTNQKLKTKAEYFLLHHLMCFISQNNSRVQIRCEIVKISLYLAEKNKYSNDNNFNRESPPFNIKRFTLTNEEASKLCFVVKQQQAAGAQKKCRGNKRRNRVLSLLFACFSLGMLTNLSFAFLVTTCRVGVYSSVT